jgi:hypothetical protein
MAWIVALYPACYAETLAIVNKKVSRRAINLAFFAGSVAMKLRHANQLVLLGPTYQFDSLRTFLLEFR